MSFINPPQNQNSNKITYWNNLHGVGISLALSEYLTEQKQQNFTLVITENNYTAELISRELKFFAPNLEMLSFPDWETLAYDYFSAHPDIISQRITTLYKLPGAKNSVLVLPINTLLQRIAPQNFIQANSLIVKIGDKLDTAQIKLNLETAGYQAVDTVYAHGEFAARGSVLDIFPMGSNHPIRIDLFGDEVDSLRIFDVETQLTINKIEHINLLPAREFAFDQDAITKFKDNFRAKFAVNASKCPIYQDVSSGIASSGIEYYLPLFFTQTANLLDYVPNKTQIIHIGQTHTLAFDFINEVKNRFTERNIDVTRPLLEPHELFLSTEELFAKFKNYAQIYIPTQNNKQNNDKQFAINFTTSQLPNVTIEPKHIEPLANLRKFSEQFNGKILFCAESAGRGEALNELLARAKISPVQLDNWQQFISSDNKFNLCIAELEQDLCLANIAIICEASLLGKPRVKQRKRYKREHSDNLIKNLAELVEGAPVVHVDHGVGRYLGLVSMEYDGNCAEFIALEYAEGAKLYVPVTNLHLIGRYTGSDAEHAPLHRLGSDKWDKAKRKAQEKAHDTAAELLDIHARRVARAGFAFTDPKADYATFAASFAFDETLDQSAAIEAVRSDMLSDKAMDRLICGDVGFGKTEVAMRAAFIAVYSGRQVAILVPTTLLAEQHYHSFKDRFAGLAVTVEVISRFKSTKEVNNILQQLEQGNIDILIGTHKLLQSSVKFNNLGLLVIDEEHRFGVRQKERLKALRSEVDILTLTATPIPRTLNMAISGMRDLSIITTPPARRLAIRTFIARSDSVLIKDAILRELQRGGQIYYVHNEVRTIEQCADKLAKLVPAARIAIGHGQMPERELEQVMSDFYHHRYNILVASTIIETGIDVPTANTIIIERADKFGLAQLHQLRGRVGRSHHQAYAYLLTPNEGQISSDAQKRLDAIVAAGDLGAGFVLATHDLEIRGAGELLGEGQSGQIHAVGFSLYMEMLDQAVKSLKNGKKLADVTLLNFGAEINLHAPVLIPNDYLPDVHARLILYKRIASANLAELRELQVEMIDRFGLMPDATKNLIQITKLKLQASEIGIKKIDVGASGGKINFAQDTTVNLDNLIRLVQQNPQTYQLTKSNSVKLRANLASFIERYKFCSQFIKQLQD